ncbi:HAD-IIIC family phosphatase [Kitasatospora acidiphila]|uniref:HAD-IIIC family phosphatase n=1 Tax=Kitasatospora acidiphila TaxID=2567942 RepID=A0A540VXD8_9ACTN|nr:HAD-IIIC family phosphatase [Kitasatospora acidiphila]TQF01425.1 HAD-IIIC family phosphatase [Kitasatospora acidiphila]
MPELVDALKAAVAAGTAPSPDLRLALAQTYDPSVLRKAGRALARLTDPDGRLRPVRLSVVAACTVGPLEPLLRACLVGAGALPAIEVAPYGTFELTLATGGFDHAADLLLCLLDESYFLPDDLDATAPEAAGPYLEERLAQLSGLVGAALHGTEATLVLHTVPLPRSLRDTMISLRTRSALTRLWHRLNAGLLALAEEHPQVQVVDLVGLLAESSVAARDQRLHKYADLPYTDGALLILASEVRRIAQARSGLSKKVLALDLDNTLWGGVLGEVGSEGVELGGLYPGKSFQDLQRTVSRLREQGVVLVLASKNDAGPVEEALSRHPAVLLRPEAFSVSMVNWAPKAGNLHKAADTLGLGTDSFVFMDDSDFERGSVAAELPEVAIIDSSGEPAQLVDSLVRHGWFDVVELTGTDLKRPELYRARSLRNDFSGGFSKAEDYLKALDLRVAVEPVTRFTVARAAQLAARTNQFNLTGVRFDEAATIAMIDAPDRLALTVSVTDRFGDEGLVGAVWLERTTERWSVLNLVLSCRVLSRGVEFAIAGRIAALAAQAGAEVLEGRFTPSAKNGVAAGFWEKAGFVPDGDGHFAFAPGKAPDPTPSWITLVESTDSTETIESEERQP